MSDIHSKDFLRGASDTVPTGILSRGLIGAVTILSMWIACLPPLHAEERPNVLFIVADDLNNDLACYGHPGVRSPHIDSLAARGMRFDRAYCQYPLCNPTRASFLSGLRPDSTRVFDNGAHFRTAAPDIATLPEHFRKNGYASAGVGKMFHDGVPKGGSPLTDPQSWDFATPAHGREKDDIEKINSLIPGSVGGTVSWLADEGDPAELTDALRATAAIEWMTENHGEKPFFLAVGFYRPHTPYVAPTSFFDAHPLDQVKLFSTPFADRDDIPLAALPDKREQLSMSDEQRRRAIQGYHASTSFMDAQVGRLVATLNDLSLTDSTIIVFVSDHGYHLGEHGLWQKRSLFEESARVPLIIATPENGAGGVCERLVELVDLFPTLVELCDLPTPEHLEGRSLVPLLENPEAAFRADALTQTVCATHSLANPESPHGYSLRTKRYRYSEWAGGAEGVELFDHQTDPDERTNIAFDSGYAAVVRELRDRLRARIANGGNEAREETGNHSTEVPKRVKPFRIVTLGDLNSPGHFSSRVEEMLSKSGFPSEFAGHHVSGEDTGEALARLDGLIAGEQKPDLVALSFGANDSAIDPGETGSRIPSAKFRANLIAMVTKIREAGIVPLLMTVPFFSEKGDQPDIPLEKYNNHCRKIASELDILLVDHAAYWVLQQDSGIDIGEWTDAENQLKQEGHRQIALRMLPIVAHGLTNDSLPDPKK